MSPTNGPSASRRQPRGATIRYVLLAAALLGGLAACSSDDSAGSTTSAPDGSGTETDSGATSDGSGSDEAGSDGADEEAGSDGGAATGTVTMADGTAYTFELSTCETSDTKSYIEEGDFYDISGTTADGEFAVSFGRAPYGDGTAIEVASFEGEFDDEGKNSQLTYTDVDGTMALVVDGGNLTGTVSLSPIGPNRPYGDEVEATVDISC